MDKRKTKITLPSQNFDFVVQRILFAFQRFFVDYFHGVHFGGTFLAHGQSDFGKSTPVMENKKKKMVKFHVANILSTCA